MKIAISASSIVSLLCIFLLTGCDGIHMPNFFGHDEVPDEVKAQPHQFDVPEPSTEEKNWPRLGDVPFKPKDFSPKPDYDKAMDELEHDRSDAEAAKEDALKKDPALGDAAAQDNRLLQPPQFPEK